MITIKNLLGNKVKGYNYGEFCFTKPAINEENMKDKFLLFSWIEKGTANKTNSNLLLFIYLFFSVSFFTLFTMDLNWTTGSAI